MEARRPVIPRVKKTVVDLVDQQDWLDRVAEAVQPRITKIFRAADPVGRRLQDLLNGVWLGHPLHPVLTDIPLGAWTAAVLLDRMEEASRGPVRRGVALAADTAVALGLAGAVGSAVTGLTDWSDTYGRGRKIGAAHGLLNVSATILFAGSLLARRRGKRAGARASALLGYLVSLGAAYLGGHLVYGEQIGVNHTAAQELPKDWTPVLAESDLPEKELKKAMAGSVPVVLLRRAGRVYALAETCAHMGGPLSEGKLEGTEVICPWHASRYDMRTGEVINGPSTFPQPCFETRISGGRVEVRATTR